MTATAGMEQLYQQVILDHAKHPHGAGLREPYDAQSHQVNPTCGDEITLRVRLADDRVDDVSYDAIGCSISQAAASVLNELVVGRPVDETAGIHDAYLAMLQSRGSDPGDESLLGDGGAFAGVSPNAARGNCALRPWGAYRDALLQTGRLPTTEGSS